MKKKVTKKIVKQEDAGGTRFWDLNPAEPKFEDIIHYGIVPNKKITHVHIKLGMVYVDVDINLFYRIAKQVVEDFENIAKQK